MTSTITKSEALAITREIIQLMRFVDDCRDAQQALDIENQALKAKRASRIISNEELAQEIRDEQRRIDDKDEALQYKKMDALEQLANEYSKLKD